MARISGVDLPREKRVEIGLTYIYGIGLSSAKRILSEANEKAGIMLENAKKTIEVERQQTMNTLQSEIAGLAMQAARKIVDEETRKQGNQAIYDQFLESVGDAHDGKDE